MLHQGGTVNGNLLTGTNMLGKHRPARAASAWMETHQLIPQVSPGNVPSGAAEALRDGSALFPSMEVLKAGSCADGNTGTQEQGSHFLPSSSLDPAGGSLTTENTQHRAPSEERMRRCPLWLRSHTKADDKGRSHAWEHACCGSHTGACRGFNRRSCPSQTQPDACTTSEEQGRAGTTM